MRPSPHELAWHRPFVHLLGGSPATVHGASSSRPLHASSMSVYTQVSPDGPQVIPIGQVRLPHVDARLCTHAAGANPTSITQTAAIGRDMANLTGTSTLPHC